MKRFTALMLSIFLFCGAGYALGETVTPTDTAAPTMTAATDATPEALLQQWYDIGALLRANGLYPFTELRKGDEGYEVRALQTRLAELGYYTKAIVDEFGKGTYSAMRAFEKTNGLKVNGIASVADQKVLFGSAAVAGTTEKSTSSTRKTDATSAATSD